MRGAVEVREPRIVYSVVPNQHGAKPERFMVSEQAGERADTLASKLAFLQGFPRGSTAPNGILGGSCRSRFWRGSWDCSADDPCPVDIRAT
jgi:hypothetical protein